MDLPPIDLFFNRIELRIFSGNRELSGANLFNPFIQVSSVKSIREVKRPRGMTAGMEEERRSGKQQRVSEG